MKAWQVCEHCGDDWCNLHGMHSKDCPCPMHHEWESDPLHSNIRTVAITDEERQAIQDGIDALCTINDDDAAMPLRALFKRLG